MARIYVSKNLGHGVRVGESIKVDGCLVGIFAIFWFVIKYTFLLMYYVSIFPLIWLGKLTIKGIVKLSQNERFKKKCSDFSDRCGTKVKELIAKIDQKSKEAKPLRSTDVGDAEETNAASTNAVSPVTSEYKRKLTVEEFYAAGVTYYTENILKLSNYNEDYRKRSTTIANSELAGQKVFKYKSFVNKPVKLIPEPQNEYDKNAVIIQIAGEKVGYISSDENEHVLWIINNCEVKYISSSISGGAYKIVAADGEMFKFDDEEFSVRCRIGYVVPEETR